MVAGVLSQTVRLARCWVTWACSLSVRRESADRSSWAPSGSRPAPAAKTTQCAVHQGEVEVLGGGVGGVESQAFSASEASEAGGGSNCASRASSETQRSSKSCAASGRWALALLSSL